MPRRPPDLDPPSRDDLVIRWRSFAAASLHEHRAPLRKAGRAGQVGRWGRDVTIPRRIRLLACRAFIRRTRAELLDASWRPIVQELDRWCGAEAGTASAHGLCFHPGHGHDLRIGVGDELDLLCSMLERRWRDRCLRTPIDSASERFRPDRDSIAHDLDASDVLGLACAEWATALDPISSTSSEPGCEDRGDDRSAPAAAARIRRMLSFLSIAALTATRFADAAPWYGATFGTLGDHARCCARRATVGAKDLNPSDQLLGVATRWIVSGHCCSLGRGSPEAGSRGGRPLKRVVWRTRSGARVVWVASEVASDPTIVLRILDPTGGRTSAYDGALIRWLGTRALVVSGRAELPRNLMRRAFCPLGRAAEPRADVGTRLSAQARTLVIDDQRLTAEER